MRKGAFPLAESLAASVLSLPIGPQLTPEQATHVARETIHACKAIE